ncbi:hypothetical protein J8I26_09895 [Herbaspirillum sp. LeCh32-8]|uniref:hypothetical protein n=1 Tax=Herbaspirillum sp. LeCh32-8 TaxID=2821356 RepID=UPI001AE3A8ED|nr:hypothetical protein [Herbaspirillum sp. LeCh32-8]MBP0598416.1 hypothetical protein [Herbaspirillum sp. LeCh32-8]
MYLLLLIVGALALATACGLLQASAKRSRKLRRLSALHTPAARSPALSPQAREHAIQAYRAMQDMALSDTDALPEATVMQRPARSPARSSPARKIVPATPKIARMRWQQRQVVASGK